MPEEDENENEEDPEDGTDEGVARINIQFL